MGGIKVKYNDPKVFKVEQQRFMVRILDAEAGTYGDNVIGLTFTEILDPYSEPATTDFSVSLSGGAATVTLVQLYGSSTLMTLALDRSVVAGETGTVTYTPGTTPILSEDGEREGAAFAMTITNNVS